jgi:hypothetical protein
MKELMKAVTVSFVCLLLTACGKDPAIVEAERILAGMTCQLPNGMQPTEPFLELSPNDVTRINLAKKAIESMRRKDSDHNWNMSATMFYLSQMNLARARGNLANDKEKLAGWIEGKKSGRYYLNQPINEVAAKQASFFNDACKDYIDSTNIQSKLLAEAKNIPDDFLAVRAGRPNKMPCPILNEQGCKP